MEIAFNSSHPYNFTYALHPVYEKYGALFLANSYWPFRKTLALFPALLLQSLKNVRLQFANSQEIRRRLSKVTKIKKDESDDAIKQWAISHGIIDTAAIFFNMVPITSHQVHVAPISFYTSFVIVSSVSSESRRERSQTLSFQGLPSSVWLLVAFSLLVVTELATYLTEKKKRRKNHALNSWMSSVWIYAADILNNCVTGVVRPGPGRHLRSCWLLLVAFLIQFWSAGMKSDLLLDRASFIDSLEDLLSKPELLCLIWKDGAEPFLVTEDHPRYKDIQKMKKRYVDGLWGEKSHAILSSGSGVIMDQDLIVMNPSKGLGEKLKEAKRKKYIGKERYNGEYGYMRFNKRLPRAIKEDIDYLISRLVETRQNEPRLRYDNFHSREYTFNPTEKSASTMSWSAQSVNYLSTVFRMWIIGNSLATFVFCVEFFRSRLSIRGRPVKASLHSIGI